MDWFEVNLKYNTFHRREGCCRPEDVKIKICYSKMTSKQSINFFHTLLVIKYTSNMQYIVKNLVCLFTAVAVLVCVRGYRFWPV